MDRTQIFAHLKQISMDGPAGELPPQGAFMPIGPEGHQVPAHFFSAEAIVIYLYDQGDHFRWVTMADLGNLGLDPDELYELGTSNLGTVLEGMQLRDLGSAYMLTGGVSEHTASIVLLPYFWEEMVPQLPGVGVKNSPLAAIPARDTLLFMDSQSDPEAIGRIQSQVDSLHSSDTDHLLCKKLYKRTREGVWSVYKSSASEGEIIVSNADLVGPDGGMLNKHQIGLMAASGYTWNFETQCFHKVGPTPPGAADRPWQTAEWLTES